MPAGAKGKYTDGVTVARILEFLSIGGTQKGACGYAGISEETYYNWLDDHLEFNESVKPARLEALKMKESQLAAIRRDDPHWFAALLFWLKTQGGYRENFGVQHSGEVKVVHERSEKEIAAQKELARLTPAGRESVIESFRRALHEN